VSVRVRHRGGSKIQEFAEEIWVEVGVEPEESLRMRRYPNCTCNGIQSRIMSGLAWVNFVKMGNRWINMVGRK